MEPVAAADVTRFGLEYDVGDATGVLLDTTISELSGKLSTIWTTLEGMLFKVREREATITDFTTTQSALLNLSLRSIEDTLSGPCGLDKEISSLSILSSIPSYIKKILPLQLKLGMIQKRIKEVNILCEQEGYRKIYMFLSTFVDELRLQVVESPQAPNQCKERYDEVKQKFGYLEHPAAEHLDKTERKKFLECKRLYLEALSVCSLAAQLKGIEIDGLEGAIRTVTADLALYEKRSLQSRDDSSDATSSDEQPKQESSKPPQAVAKSASFLTKAPILTQLDYYWPTRLRWTECKCIKTGELGVSLHQKVRDPLDTLIGTIFTRLPHFCQGDRTSKDGHKAHTRELNGYRKELSHLNNEFKRLFPAPTTFDSLTKTLLDFSYSTEQGFRQARGFLKLAYDFTSDVAIELFDALEQVSAVLKDPHPNSLERVFELYSAACTIRKSPPEGKKFVATFFRGIYALLREVIAKKEAQLFKLTDDESEVADHIFATPLEMLTQKWGERLPQAVIGFLTKRMMPLVLLKSGKDDIELRLVFYRLFQSQDIIDLYNSARDENKLFNQLMEEYVERPIELETASFIAAKIAESKQAGRDLFAYAEAIDSYVVYSKESPDDAICAFLLKKLDLAAKKSGYPYFYPTVETRALDQWDINNPEAFKKQLRTACEEFRPGMEKPTEAQIWNSLFVKATSIVLHTNDEKERLEALFFIHTLLQNPSYKQFWAVLPQDIECLLAQTSLKKLAFWPFQESDPFITDPEMKILMQSDGLFVEALEQDDDMEEIDDIIFKFVAYEERLPEESSRTVTQLVKKYRRRTSFKLWLSKKQKPLNSDQIAKLFNEGA